ncbi:endonuclease G, mitochondrial [Labeo rohita]|uniref:endonuclease G, mitochondrial n=1 Tax=Labeo rohita TaxID=84645 RepID=UPI0021E2642C|nr:endonuclease G, mitochondrial [Labeo rohita]
MHDQMKAERENGRGKNCLRSTDDISQAQSSAAPNIVVAAKGVKQQTTNRNQGQTGSVSQCQTRTPFQPTRQSSGNDPGAPNDQSGIDFSAASESETGAKKRGPIYIRIPLTEMFDKNKTSAPPKPGSPFNSVYKLIDCSPQAEKNDNKKSNKIIKKQFYVMSYDKEKNNSEWVYEILNVSTLPSYYKKPTFRDSDSDSDYKLSNSNPFKSTGYDRGHLAAAANHTWCQEAYKKTFLMYNITPQYSNFNRGKWKKLEEYCRKKIISETVRNVHVYTGPLYLKETENVGEKVVPSHFFKVVIVEKEGEDIELECYTLPNEKSKDNENSEEDTENDWLNPYKVDITDIEKMSGLKFTESCPELTKEDYTRTATWMGNKGKKSVTIDVTISSCKKNYEDPQGFNEE